MTKRTILLLKYVTEVVTGSWSYLLKAQALESMHLEKTHKELVMFGKRKNLVMPLSGLRFV